MKMCQNQKTLYFYQEIIKVKNNLNYTNSNNIDLFKRDNKNIIFSIIKNLNKKSIYPLKINTFKACQILCKNNS